MMADASYHLKLIDCGPEKVKVIRFLHDQTGRGLYEIKIATDKLPWTIVSDYGPIGREDAMRILRPLAEGLEALGPPSNGITTTGILTESRALPSAGQENRRREIR